MCKLVVVNQQPQMKEKRTTNIKKVRRQKLVAILVLEMSVRPFTSCSAVAASTDHSSKPLVSSCLFMPVFFFLICCLDYYKIKKEKS